MKGMGGGGNDGDGRWEGMKEGGGNEGDGWGRE